ncbi:CrcB protein [Methanomicrobium sp. W14]|uniref:fluoride efflux transporter CrcB n=1 Tax=Methanomicrobium sp. W14 TaxID=2817839 RepID=UPI001AE8BD02|nr:fluoride efflux transporter CrcB [Methanomicrobium sp. W14]MBP2133459.1 CrcB protein [Methanomicrobium sp. W14]
MNALLLVGVGGFVGAIGRYLISGWIQDGYSSFPLGTMGVNVIGSFLLGFVMYMTEYTGVFSDETRIFLTIGLIGAFTTMSTFSYESFRMLEDSNALNFFLNVGGTLFLTLMAVWAGRIIAKIAGGLIL